MPNKNNYAKILHNNLSFFLNYGTSPEDVLHPLCDNDLKLLLEYHNIPVPKSQSGKYDKLVEFYTDPIYFETKNAD
jgi:hypothetical protein